MNRNSYCGLVAGVGVGVDLDLRGQVRSGVALLPHRQRRHLRVAQVELVVGVVHAARQVALVVARGQHVLPPLAHDDGRAGVLAHGQHVARGDVGVLQQVHRDEAVVGAGLRIVQDRRQLAQVCRAQQVGDVLAAPRMPAAARPPAPPSGRFGSPRKTSSTPSVVMQPVRSVVRLEGQHLGVAEVRHGFSVGLLSRGGAIRSVTSATTRRMRGSPCEASPRPRPRTRAREGSGRSTATGRPRRSTGCAR